MTTITVTLRDNNGTPIAAECSAYKWTYLNQDTLREISTGRRVWVGGRMYKDRIGSEPITPSEQQAIKDFWLALDALIAKAKKDHEAQGAAFAAAEAEYYSTPVGMDELQAYKSMDALSAKHAWEDDDGFDRAEPLSNFAN